MTSTSIAARVGAILAAGATAAILTAVPAVASTTSTTPPDCIALEKAEKALTAAQKAASAAENKDSIAQSKLTTDQAHGAAKTVIDADEAALGTAQSNMFLAKNAVWTAQGNVERAKEAIQRDGVHCPGGPTPTPTTTPSSPPPSKPNGSTNGSTGTSSSSNSSSTSSDSVVANGGNATGGSAQADPVVNPTVVLDPTAGDGSQATTSGSEVSDVPTGSASTGAA